MVDTHQSYEDFQLDALLQYDLADDEDDDYHADTDSIHSNAVDDAAFHELYDSIPVVIPDTNDAISTSGSKVSTDRSSKLRNVTKMIRPPRLQIHKLNRSASSRSVQSDDDYILQGKSNSKSKQKSFNKKHSLILSVGKILLPKRNSKAQSNDSRLQRGIKRNVSCRTEGSTVSWLSDDLSRQLSHVQLIEEDMSSTGSQCYLEDDDDENNENQSNCCSEVFVDECYKVMMGNDTSNDNNNSSNHRHPSNDTLSSSDDNDVVDDDRFFNRSLPIIESRGLQSLFYDTNICNNKNKNIIDISTDDDSSEEKLVSGRRPYTISDF